jgi:cytochrome d ubiquinol oxidase subunit II
VSLPVLWFAVVALFWAGFFVLEGFDFGVGALHRYVADDDVGRRVAINAVGPFWDGNEVWLIVAGAAIFAAFPSWYATWFSAGYLALVLVLVALIIRGVSFEYRGKSHDPRWRGTFSAMLTAGSVLAPLLLGVALGDLLAGLPVDSSGEFTGTFWDLLTPYGLLTCVTLLVLCLLQGAVFLVIRTTDDVLARARGFARRLALPALVLVALFAAATVVVSGQGARAAVLPAAAVLAAVTMVVCVRAGRDGAAFAASSVTIGAAVLAVFGGLYPNVLVSSSDPAWNLTVENTASGQYALTVMTWVAVLMFPVVLLYQGWTYVVFRRRLSPPQDADALSVS